MMIRFFGGKREGTGDMKRFKISMIVYYAVIILGITVFLSVSTIGKMDDVLKAKVSELTADLNVQMRMNLDSYLSRVETMATLVFAEKDAYLYDATDENNDKYEALNTENVIKDKLYSICLMENFVDFGIVYSNNHVVGKLSNNTKDLFGNQLYEDLAGIINRERTHDGWLAGYHGNYTRIYYVKRVNDNAVLLTSFYATELEDVFEHPGGIADITIRLVEDNDVMIYSSLDGETGTVMGEDITGRIRDYDSATLMDDDYLITVNPTGDNWRVISSVPTQIILKEKNTVQMFILMVGTLAAIIATVLSVIFSFGLSSSVDKKFTTLDKQAHMDQLTGVLNKRSFEVKVDSLLRHNPEGTQYALMLIDIDDFKSVNDTFGHAYGDKVLAGIGDGLRHTFRSGDTLGRLGGDEFCVCMSIRAGLGEEERRKLVDRKCQELCAALRRQETVGGKEYKGSVSVGVSVHPENGATFNELYRMADSALYATKRKGKDHYTIYGEEA